MTERLLGEYIIMKPRKRRSLYQLDPLQEMSILGEINAQLNIIQIDFTPQKWGTVTRNASTLQGFMGHSGPATQHELPP